MENKSFGDAPQETATAPGVSRLPANSSESCRPKSLAKCSGTQNAWDVVMSVDQESVQREPRWAWASLVATDCQAS